MKLRHTAFLIVLSLFLLQLGVAVAASFHQQNQADLPMKTSCHHEDISQQTSDKSELSSQTEEDHSCCKTGCQCGVSGCGSPVMINRDSTEHRHIVSASVHSFYAFSLPQTLQNSLFRPPIFS